jgi:hypothetical protein
VESGEWRIACGENHRHLRVSKWHCCYGSVIAIFLGIWLFAASSMGFGQGAQEFTVASTISISPLGAWSNDVGIFKCLGKINPQDAGRSKR